MTRGILKFAFGLEFITKDNFSAGIACILLGGNMKNEVDVELLRRVLGLNMKNR